ncbi:MULTISPECIES: kynureninase [unclassified Wenzhouxiangella]|uniref:kynureninase n=1 Tax=unclassified Wenzhouxiangella TaxID=2613841 RepID=UPI000E32676C|nr:MULTISPECIES: kynureninase [unclassified Wenzhouxiangella]RFF27576.1 kynureninase [Wenzhouxiangella sp. 15181]RFP69670.1 kynureninase [Wenzhouxiangella sp. 15190]
MTDTRPVSAFTPGQFRDRFRIPDGGSGEPGIYLCGNSLGAQPKAAADAVDSELERWARLGVAGHFDGPTAWTEYHELLTTPLAGLCGARDIEVVATGTLTANLHQMLISFYRPRGKRRRILMEKGSFPSDRYAVASQVHLHGLDPEHDVVELAPRRDGLLHEEDVEDYLERYGEQVALVLWPGVQYATGQVFDTARICRAAQKAGSAVGLDLAHAVGNVPLNLHEDGPDFAVWCSYKYLNAGPGAIAGLFVHERHAHFDGPRLAGWWGQDVHTRFQMRPRFRPEAGAAGWQLSTLPILATAPLLASLQLFEEAGGIETLRHASLELTGYLAHLLQQELEDEIDIVTPLEPHRRGCQLSLRLHAGEAAGRRLFERLEAHGVTCDWRAPDIIRAAPAPLYNNREDVERFVELTGKLLAADTR